jgi:hypothetical protein
VISIYFRKYNKLFLILCLLHKKLLTISREGATDPSAPASLRRWLNYPCQAISSIISM